MANRNVQFNFAVGTPAAGQSATQFLALTVVDSGGGSLASKTYLPAATTDTISLPLGAGYRATLVAHDAAGAVDASPPFRVFDVTAPPPPPAPPDPILGPPVLA